MLLAVFLLALPAVQTRLGKVATNYLNTTYNTNITVAKVDLSYIGTIQLKDIEILDHHQDSLINVKNIATSIFSYRNIIDNKLEFDELELSEINLVTRTYKGEDTDSFSIFTAKFDDENDDKSPSNFLLTSSKVHLKKGNFRIVDENLENAKPLTFKNINGNIENFIIKGPNIYGDIKTLQFIENHGISIKNLTTNFTYTRQEMKLINTTLETATSKVLTDIVFHRNGSFADFNNKVKFDAIIKKADVSLIDLNKFYNEFGEKDNLHFTANLTGTLNNFTVNNLELISDLKSVIVGDLHVINSFNTEKGFSVNAKLKNLTSNYNQLKNLLPNILGKTLPSTFKQLGKFTITGNTFVNSETIDAQIKMKSDLGTTISDLKLTNIDNIDNASYKGHVKIIDFELGKFVKDSLIGKLSLEADIDGKGFTIEKVKAKIKGTISKHQYKGYTYQNIDMNGVFADKKFNGSLISHDKNIKFNFDGLADLSSDVYKFNFKTQVEYANFNALNLFKRDSISIIKGNLAINLVGNSIDDLAGNINIKNASYINQNDTYIFKDFNINSSFKDKVRTIAINSPDIVKGRVEGVFKFAELGKLIQNSAGSIYTNYHPFPVSSGQYLDFKFKIYNKIVEVFFPKVFLGKNTSVRGLISADDNKFKLNLRSPKIDVYNNNIKGIRLQIDNKNPLFNTQLSVNNIKTKYYDVADLNLVNVTLNDTLFFRTEFVGGKMKKETYDLGFYHTIDKNNKSVVGMNASTFKYKNTIWHINSTDNKNNKVVFDSHLSNFDIYEFDFKAGLQKINLSGFLKGADKNLNATFKDVNLAGITPKVEGWNFAGLINGTLKYEETQNKIFPVANISIEDFFVNESYQGNLKIDMKGKNSVKKFDVNVSIKDNNTENFLATGNIDLSVKKPTIDMNVEFNKFKIDLLDPIGGDNFTNIRGFAYGATTIKGLLENPDMNGELFLDSSGIAFPYLNVDYDFEGTTVIELKKQTFDIVDLTLHDTTHKTRGTMLGTITHHKFSDWKLDLDINTNNLLVLDTKESEDALYYGKGFLDGNASIAGFTDNLTIDVVGKTNKNTHFIIPLSDVKTINSTNLVTFVTDKKEKNFEIPTEVLLEKFKGLSLNFDLEVTKDAVVEMIIDKTTGSTLKGSGTGDLRIEIDTKGKFNMYGDFIIDNGFYDYKYGGFVNKKFIAIKGGSVSWDGSPYTADLNIETKYRVNANPKSILENVTTTRDIPVDLIVKFTGELYDSKKEYDILIPDAGSDLTSELDFKINQNNDTNTKLKHFTSLLFFGSFFNENIVDNSVSLFLSETGEELFSSLINSALSGGNDKIKVGGYYKIGDDRSKVANLNTDDQFGITLATQISDRILIDGQVGVPVGSKQQAIKSEVKIEFLLNDEGTLRSTIFNRQNEIQYTEEEEGYTQGVGLSYQFNFNTTKEFLEKIGLRKKVVKDTIKPKDSLLLKKKEFLLNKSNLSKDQH